MRFRTVPPLGNVLSHLTRYKSSRYNGKSQLCQVRLMFSYNFIWNIYKILLYYEYLVEGVNFNNAQNKVLYHFHCLTWHTSINNYNTAN